MSTVATKALPETNAPTSFAYWDIQNVKGHSVQFYEEETRLLDGLARYVGGAVGAGDFAIVIATPPHRQALEELLTSRGLDLQPAIQEGRFVSLDAAETLAKLTMDGLPDRLRFNEVVGDVIRGVAEKRRQENRRIVAFGEMVALLWAEGKMEAAIRLEQFWNELSEKYTFQLHCAYPMSLFPHSEDGKGIQRICGEHSHVVPAEGYTALANEKERDSEVVFLQQRAMALEAEMLERARIQQAFEQREAELNDFLESAVIAMHWVDANGTIIWANRAELKLFGYEREEYIGRPIADFHVDKPVIDDILRRLKRNEELQEYEARVRCKDGSIRHVRIDSNVFSREGKFVHTRCFTIDLTEKKSAEQAAMRLAAIVESAEDAIISKDLNGVVTSWNNGAEDILGYQPEEMIGKPILLVIPPELRDEETVILTKIRAGERVEHFQTVRMRKDGTRIDVSLTISPVRDKRGKIIGAAKILRDITKQKKLEAALHVSERLASVGRLAATVAHEINNPLEAVTNFIYLAKQQPDISDKMQRYLNLADKELARVAHIAQQTLGFYRDNSQPVPLVIDNVIDDVLTVYSRKLEYKRITVETEVARGLTVNTLQGELKQVISNLIANSIDACVQGDRIRIRARFSRDFKSGTKGMRLTVADNGSGISEENKPKLFVPFFTTKKEVGTGLGLWVTKDLMKKNGGHIRFRSNSAQRHGTVMSVYLPLAAPAGKELAA